MSTPTLLVRPGSPATPQFVDIDCAQMDITRTIQLLVNGVVRLTLPVELTGGAVGSFLVPAGPVRNALRNLNACVAEFTEEGEILCSVSDGDGDSMALRYL